MKNSNEIDYIYEKLSSLYPNYSNKKPKAKIYSKAYTSLIGVMLSAQSQDKRTAIACRQLFSLADTPEEMIKLTQEEIIEAIRPAGLHNAKSKNIPPQYLREALNFARKEQNYWYDHPISIDASIEENEILYGLQKLDEAIDFEKNRGIIKPHAKISMILSISVTHIGMEELAERYVADLINENLRIKNLKFPVLGKPTRYLLINSYNGPSISDIFVILKFIKQN
mgnify:CR=1 FL=1